ncbi:DUF3035 domain-containing protein [Roseovarius sp. B08]|uniref:DUF3035 domain-containing protein n=1 Tax=Roseovarius sp. B08 TaxID=3449223 RepID=UPI003EDBD097
MNNETSGDFGLDPRDGGHRLRWTRQGHHAFADQEHGQWTRGVQHRPRKTPSGARQLFDPARPHARREQYHRSDPRGDGVAALGGNPAALANTGIGQADGGLVNYANRFGVVPGIRQTLAREDVEIRRQRGRVNILNIGRNDDYNLAYRRQWLDSNAEATRLRRIGVPTPSYPPDAGRR